MFSAASFSNWDSLYDLFDLNIPLAYIDVDYSKYNISKIVEPNFSVNNKTILYPEQKFENKDFLLFNEFEEEVEKNNVFISTNSGRRNFGHIC